MEGRGRGESVERRREGELYHNLFDLSYSQPVALT